LGNHSTSYYYVVNTVLTYISSPIIGPTVVPATRFRYSYNSIIIDKLAVTGASKRYILDNTDKGFTNIPLMS